MVVGFCLKGKHKVEIANPVYALNKKGRPVAMGTCPQHPETKVYKILSKEETPPDLAEKARKWKEAHGGAYGGGEGGIVGGARRRRSRSRSRSKSRSRSRGKSPSKSVGKAKGRRTRSRSRGRR